MRKLLRWALSIPAALLGIAGILVGLAGLGLIALSLKLIESLDKLD